MGEGRLGGAVVLAALLAGCDPIWSVHAQLRDPAHLPISGATLAVACPADAYERGADRARPSDARGEAIVAGLGDRFPVGCDIYIAKAGFHTLRVLYRELCPKGPEGCDRGFDFALVLVPDAPTSAALRRAF